MRAFFPARARVMLVGVLLLPLVGCASSSYSGVPVEQLTVRFNAELTQHWGEYRLIRTELKQTQFTWQLYTDGQLVEQGKLPLPKDGLGSLFAEMSEAAAIPGATTEPSLRENDLDNRIYVIHLTYQTPDNFQQAESSGTLQRIARTLQESPQAFALHQRIVRKLPQAYWFAHLDQTHVPEWTPQDQGTAQAQAR
jgi:hypothetical protein